MDSLLDGVVDESVRMRPAAPLRPYVAWYSGYRQAGVAPALHRGLPSPYLTLILTLDDPLTLAGHPDPRQAPGEYDTLIGGLHTSPAFIRHEGRQSGVQIALHPLGARALLGLPAGELAATDLPADVVLRQAGGWQDRIRDAESWSRRFAILDEVLLAGVRDRVDIPSEVAYAWHLLKRSRGTVPVSELASEVGWSPRHLSDLLQRETGLAPKAAARVFRFDRARRLLVDRLDRPQPLRLADVAAECGYFDQAHLARDFRQLAGCAPTAWLAEEFRNVQAGRWATETDWIGDQSENEHGGMAR